MKKGLVYALFAYLSWGIFPLFWKALSHVNALQSLAHRLVWTFVLVGSVVIITGRMPEYIQILKNKKTLLKLLMSITLLMINWFLFIWAVNHNRVVEASLGYFLNPLVSILLGVIFLKEKLNFWQNISIIIALIGMVFLISSYGSFPFIAVILAFCFSFYGLIRKTAEVESLVGLFVEITYVVPLAFIFLFFKGINGEGAFGLNHLPTTLLLMITGPVTALPLIWFAHGAKRLPLTWIGFLQYIAPTLQFLIGVLLFKEPFPVMLRISFSFIWLSLLIFTLSKTAILQNMEALIFNSIKK